MDLASIIGLVLTLGLLFGAMAMGVGIGPYIDIPSVLIVFGGTTGVMMLGFKMEHLKGAGKAFMIAIKPPEYNIPELIAKLVDFATKARKEGILALEEALTNEENEFLKKGLSMAIDGNEPDAIRELMETEMSAIDKRHKVYTSFFGQIAGFSGAMGMIGTLIGLVAMLLNMADPSAIGPSMAVALLTTMYGAMLGNIIGAPVENILLLRNSDEQQMMTIVVDGIMSIQAGDNPRNLESKLFSFLPENQRESQFN